MKKQILAISFLLFSICAIGQNDVTVLNGYKYVYLVPWNYDLYSVRERVQEKLISCGLNVYDSQTVPTDVKDNPCLICICNVEGSSNAIGKVKVTFLNCAKEKIYYSEGQVQGLVWTYETGWQTATNRAMSDFNNYKYEFDENKSYQNQFIKNLPTVEKTEETEQSFKDYLDKNHIDQIEGIYKSYQSAGLPYYKIGIKKYDEKYKAIILETDENVGKFWKRGEVKAYFENTSMKGFYSVKWYMANKTVFETFGKMDNEALLTIELKDQKTGEKTQDKFIKMYPMANSDITYKKDNAKTSGSGFFINSGGILATNAHVIENASNIKITISNEIGNFDYKAKVLLIDSKNDVALLQIDDSSFKGLNTIPYGFIDNSEVGEKVFTIGYPLNDVMGSNYKLTDGIISSKTGIGDDVRYYQISVPLQPGNSGGPLFNKEGNIIGLTSARLNSNAVGIQIENVNYAIKSAYLIDLIKMLPSPPIMSTTSQVATKELQDQVKILKNYVCLIKIY